MPLLLPNSSVLKRRLHARFVAEADVARLSSLPRAALREQVWDLSGRVLAEDACPSPAVSGRPWSKPSPANSSGWGHWRLCWKTTP